MNAEHKQIDRVASIPMEQCSVYARRRGRPKEMQQMPAGATLACIVLRGSPDDAGGTPHWRVFMVMSVVTYLCAKLNGQTSLHDNCERLRSVVRMPRTCM